MAPSLPTPNSNPGVDITPMTAAMGGIQGFSSQQSMEKKQAESAAEQIRTANRILDSLAAQFPAASREVEKAKQALTGILGKIVGSQAQSETQPPTGVMG